MQFEASPAILKSCVYEEQLLVLQGMSFLPLETQPAGNSIFARALQKEVQPRAAMYLLGYSAQ